MQTSRRDILRHINLMTVPIPPLLEVIYSAQFDMLRCFTGWVAINMGIFFGLLKLLGLFRVDAKAEEEGLDHSYHGGSAYGGTAGEKHTQYKKVTPFPFSHLLGAVHF